MGKCQEYVQGAQKDIEDSHDAINAVFHCLEVLAQAIDALTPCKGTDKLRRKRRNIYIDIKHLQLKRLVMTLP